MGRAESFFLNTQFSCIFFLHIPRKSKNDIKIHLRGDTMAKKVVAKAAPKKSAKKAAKPATKTKK